jgi:glycosyltransferase involved in cell wall biosynthesis
MVSIITITFNNYEELVSTLRSVHLSEGIESVVINGGSCIKTVGFLETYPGTVIIEPDKGISDAFNKGVIVSRGNYVMFLNSGDLLINRDYPLDAEKILDENKGFSFVHSNILLDDKLAGSLTVRPRKKNIGRGMPYLHPSMIIRKSVFNDIGFFDLSKKIAMDYEFTIRMEKHGLKGFYLNYEPVVKMNGMGISIDRESESIKESYQSLKQNNFLSPGRFFNFGIRLVLFYCRMLMYKIRAGKLLGILKKLKYNKTI